MGGMQRLDKLGPFSPPPFPPDPPPIARPPVGRPMGGSWSVDLVPPKVIRPVAKVMTMN